MMPASFTLPRGSPSLLRSTPRLRRSSPRLLHVSPGFLRVDALIEALGHLGGAVVRVRLVGDDSSGMYSTGWYIAPKVVVLPGFAFPGIPSRRLIGRLQVLGGQGSAWSVIATEAPEIMGEGLLGHGRKEAAIAVLHLATSSPERVLPLCFDVPVEDDPVCLIQFPGGRPEAYASFGRVRSIAENLVAYDADTEAGSSGAPVLDSSWRVLGMHVGADFLKRENYGLSRSALLNALQACQWWPEIADHHKLANTAAAQAVLQASIPDPQPPGPDTILVRAAISASLDRKSLSAPERAALRDLVIDPKAAQWTLRPAERRRVIATVGSIEALRQHRRRTRRRKRH
jgi:Trypsin-like peptidase domain